MEQLTEQDRFRLSSDIYNISRRIRQIANSISSIETQEKLTLHINRLNEIGTEIGGGKEVLIGKILRS